MEGDDEAMLSARAEQVALAVTARGLALGETITASTVSASAAASDASQTARDEGSDLPHLTLDMHDDREPKSELSLIGLIGEGGMGRVYLARQRSMRRDVAVKTLKPEATPDVARSLVREARMTGMLEHPGVIPVHALGLDDERSPMLVMKRIEGESLAERLAKEGPITGSEDRLVAGVETLIQVCRTIELAHSRGVLHRDIKPENIMLGGFGEVYLVDWGIAILKSETDDEIVGTPLYMAPEMVLGHGVDERTDVYLLGATLHEMLTGRPRHEGNTVMEVMGAALLSKPCTYDPSVPEQLARLCNRATARASGERPESAAAMREALSSFLRKRSASALAAAATLRVTELEALVASPDGPLPDLARAHRLLAEARFGLTESLRQDPAGAAAQRGMQRLGGAAVDLELRQDHLEAAEALLADIESPNPDLVHRVKECRARVAARAREQARLAELARDADPTVEAHARTRRILLLTVIASVASIAVWAFGPETTAESILFGGIAIFALLVGGILVGRKRLLANAFNRRISAYALLAMGGMVFNRLAAVLEGRPPEETFRHDLFLLGVLVVAASISLWRGIWVCLPVLAAGYAAVALWPDVATPIFIVATIGVMGVGGVALAHARRDA